MMVIIQIAVMLLVLITCNKVRIQVAIYTRK
jgi:hypothetical protein